MTIADYHVTMNEVGIAELKARLSHYLQSVRRGHPVTVTDRERPIARIVPYEPAVGLEVRRPLPGALALQEVPLPPPLDLDRDVVELLLAERQADR